MRDEGGSQRGVAMFGRYDVSGAIDSHQRPSVGRRQIERRIAGRVIQQHEQPLRAQRRRRQETLGIVGVAAEGVSSGRRGAEEAAGLGGVESQRDPEMRPQ